MIRKTIKTACAFLLLALLLSGCSALTHAPAWAPLTSPSTSDAAVLPAPAPIGAADSVGAAAGEMQVTIFDVGQADCILVSTDGHNLLIDAGNLGQDDLVCGYLAERGVDSLDYLVATHPHADHIGAMSAVIEHMKAIGAVLMPEAVSTTRVFERLLDSIEQRGLAITVPQPGDSFRLGQATIQVLSPAGDSYQDLNDDSLVLRLTFGQTAFLFAGDAGAPAETEQLAAGYDLTADVLKVGHHGSSGSSTMAYLTAVAPRWAVISCGQGNSYGHPHQQTLERLQQSGATVLRTDEMGTIVFSTDGQSIALL